MERVTASSLAVKSRSLAIKVKDYLTALA